jgi:hypothetical protein
MNRSKRPRRELDLWQAELAEVSKCSIGIWAELKSAHNMVMDAPAESEFYELFKDQGRCDTSIHAHVIPCLTFVVVPRHSHAVFPRRIPLCASQEVCAQEDIWQAQ